MKDNQKIQIGKYDYIICINDKEEKYLYRSDVEYGIGIKITFSNDTENNVKNEITKMLSNQYIEKIVIPKGI